MSTYRIVEMTCPRCNAKRVAPVWESINAGLDPEAKELLLSGKLNRLRWRPCGVEVPIEVDLLYHDMERQFCVQFFPFGRIKDGNLGADFASDGRLKLARTGIERPPHYFQNIHVVFSMDELVRYVSFRDRLYEQLRPPGQAESGENWETP